MVARDIQIRIYLIKKLKIDLLPFNLNFMIFLL